MLQKARLPTVTTIVAPHGYDWKEITAYIMKTHNLEISGGLGPSVGMVRDFVLMHFVLYLSVSTKKVFKDSIALFPNVLVLFRCCVWD